MLPKRCGSSAVSLNTRYIAETSPRPHATQLVGCTISSTGPSTDQRDSWTNASAYRAVKPDTASWLGTRAYFFARSGKSGFIFPACFILRRRVLRAYDKQVTHSPFEVTGSFFLDPLAFVWISSGQPWIPFPLTAEKCFGVDD